ncbi:hypothetical protein KPATCC21470_5777 [Kitasatospora purpeofusca]
MRNRSGADGVPRATDDVPPRYGGPGDGGPRTDGQSVHARPPVGAGERIRACSA